MPGWLRIIGVAAGATVFLYVGSFIACFDVTALPTRTQQHGWVGPAMRHNPRVIDIGSVYEYQGSNQTLYHVYTPLCKAWLWVSGLS